MNSFDQEDAYLRAKKKVENLKGFYWNLITYLIVIPVLAYVNYMTTWDEIKWFWFPAFGWGLGIAFHAFSVFGAHKVFGRDWEEQKIKQFMEKEKRSTGINYGQDND
ncbi:2TM domain-containing protein [Zhouia spongiae]|uniref:2TM domain-containing protein n=1 Tax=Zhouia spongiae TaxID=2202721 RepID=A0ABY3YIT1_9FLAO|nr:2TM domain-containing protein [Zhouia spongiae]UNY97613.1 2TM domain-containing protein [Zhouia spongiae]